MDVMPEDTIEIRDTEIDADAIMRQIREKIRERRAEAEAQGVDFEGWVEEAAARRFSDDLYRDMRRISASSAQMGVTLSLLGGRNIPVLSALIRRVRQALHELVVYYVNQLAAQQNHYNRQIVNMLMRFVVDLERESHAEQIAALQQEVQVLRDEMARLSTDAGTMRE